MRSIRTIGRYSKNSRRSSGNSDSYGSPFAPYCNGIPSTSAPGATNGYYGDYVTNVYYFQPGSPGYPGYTASPDNGGDGHADGSGPGDKESNVRGFFNRSGCKISLLAPDGTSNTLLIGESLPEYNCGGVSGYPAAGSWSGWWTNDGAHAMISTIIPINYQVIKDDTDPTVCQTRPGRSRSNWAVADGFKSNHTGGANFVFADGSVHFINQNIDQITFIQLAVRNDGEVISNTDF